MMTTVSIDISKSFSKYPGGRVRSDGPYSGQVFRDDVLIPAINNNEKVVLIIDGVMGYGSSFLEECFGGLIRQGLDPNIIKEKLSIKFENPEFATYEREIWDYILGR